MKNKQEYIKKQLRSKIVQSKFSPSKHISTVILNRIVGLIDENEKFSNIGKQLKPFIELRTKVKINEIMMGLFKLKEETNSFRETLALFVICKHLSQLLKEIHLVYYSKEDVQVDIDSILTPMYITYIEKAVYEYIKIMEGKYKYEKQDRNKNIKENN